MPLLNNRIPKIFTSDQLHDAVMKVKRSIDARYPGNGQAELTVKVTAGYALTSLMVELGLTTPEAHYEPKDV